MAHILFGLAVIPVGLGHIFYVQITTTLVPSWMPFRMGLAYLTGAGQIACGLAVAFSLYPRIAAFLETAMLALFAFLVWGPNTHGFQPLQSWRGHHLVSAFPSLPF